MPRRFHRTRPPQVSAYPAEIEVLLDDVRQLRTTMASDLSTAAAAVDSDAQGVARDIIEANRGELAALGRRVTGPTTAGQPPSPSTPRRRGARETAVLTAAVPILAAVAVSAAAFAGYTVHRGDAPDPARRTHQAAGNSNRALDAGDAHSTLRALTADVRRGAALATITADALRLRDQLASLAVRAEGDSGALATVRRMLAAEAHLLSRYRGRGDTVALADVRRLDASLVLATTALTRTTTSHPSPASTAVPIRAHSTAGHRTKQARVRRVNRPRPSATEPSTPQPTVTPRLPLPSVTPSVPDGLTG
jgi:hypothetical protein